MKKFIKKFAPPFLFDCYHFILALLGTIFYFFPSKQLKVIGVTGTNGKTSTVEMISKILEEAGFKVALLNSIRFKIGEQEWENDLRMTMPGRFFLQRFLRKAVNVGCQYAVLEVTSEGIKQHRHKFIDFEIAVFTNLTPEHIEAHGSFENYRAAKGKLFQATKNIHIINLDDENANYFLQFPAKKKWIYTLKEEKKETQKTEQYHRLVRGTVQASAFPLVFLVNSTDFKIHLFGEFNISNALAAICVGLSQGVNLETCKKALEKIEGIPGRMELVISKPFKVFVDYAFTPNALEKVYRTLANFYESTANIREYSRGRRFGDQNSLKLAKRKLICVLGASGGGRDKWKRPVLGEIAAKYCDEVIVTNEDPYDEEPREIINQVAEGARGKAKIVSDRREALREALNLAKTGDIVIITGKGCEGSIVVGSKKIPWDDRKVAREEFEKINE